MARDWRWEIRVYRPCTEYLLCRDPLFLLLFLPLGPSLDLKKVESRHLKLEFSVKEREGREQADDLREAANGE
jgi:hypothetical protein